jgi:hypothetical protein
VVTPRQQDEYKQKAGRRSSSQAQNPVSLSLPSLDHRTVEERLGGHVVVLSLFALVAPFMRGALQSRQTDAVTHDTALMRNAIDVTRDAGASEVASLVTGILAFCIGVSVAATALVQRVVVELDASGKPPGERFLTMGGARRALDAADQVTRFIRHNGSSNPDDPHTATYLQCVLLLQGLPGWA